MSILLINITIFSIKIYFRFFYKCFLRFTIMLFFIILKHNCKKITFFRYEDIVRICKNCKNCKKTAKKFSQILTILTRCKNATTLQYQGFEGKILNSYKILYTLYIYIIYYFFYYFIKICILPRMRT